MKAFIFVLGLCLSLSGQVRADGDSGDGGGVRPSKSYVLKNTDLLSYKNRGEYAVVLFNLAKISAMAGVVDSDRNEDSVATLFRINMLRSHFTTNPDSLPEHMDGEEFVLLREKSPKEEFAKVEIRTIRKFHYMAPAGDGTDKQIERVLRMESVKSLKMAPCKKSAKAAHTFDELLEIQPKTGVAIPAGKVTKIKVEFIR